MSQNIGLAPFWPLLIEPSQLVDLPYLRYFVGGAQILPKYHGFTEVLLDSISTGSSGRTLDPCSADIC